MTHVSKVQWTDCSDRIRHAFRIDEKGRHERVSVCGEIYHPEINRIENPRQLGLPFVCPACEDFERLMTAVRQGPAQEVVMVE